MIPQAKILRVFQLIGLLKGAGRTVSQIANLQKTTVRTVYRYFKLLEEIGFIIEQDFNGRYFIHRDIDESPDDRFTLEEVNYLQTIIQKNKDAIPLHENLLNKLALHSEAHNLPEQFLKLRVARIFRALNEAMEAKHQVVLKDYHSANSQEVKDRIVEPFQFGNGYQSVQALDLKDKQCKFFKLERIGDIEVTDKPYRYTKLHEKTTTDVFGISGKKEVWVTMQLSLRAYVLLREEFPLTMRYIEREGSDDARRYVFQGPVLNFKGIGRFVMGLPDEIQIVTPPEFKIYIKEKYAQQKLF